MAISTSSAAMTSAALVLKRSVLTKHSAKLNTTEAKTIATSRFGPPVAGSAQQPQRSAARVSCRGQFADDDDARDPYPRGPPGLRSWEAITLRSSSPCLEDRDDQIDEIEDRRRVPILIPAAASNSMTSASAAGDDQTVRNRRLRTGAHDVGELATRSSPRRVVAAAFCSNASAERCWPPPVDDGDVEILPSREFGEGCDELRRQCRTVADQGRPTFRPPPARPRASGPRKVARSGRARGVRRSPVRACVAKVGGTGSPVQFEQLPA